LLAAGNLYLAAGTGKQAEQQITFRQDKPRGKEEAARGRADARE
jgi:hypothetical protein